MATTLQNIIISRTDSIGDVVLTLPMAAVLKTHFPQIKIAFLGKKYTQPIIEACRHIDAFIDLDDFLSNEPITVCGEKPAAIIHVFPLPAIARRARQLGIPIRIGTTNRIYHWLTCNRLVRLSRRKSDLHEAQLNVKLLAPLGCPVNFSTRALGQLCRLHPVAALPASVVSLLDDSRYNLILHPKSQGSAREWGLPNFIELVKTLDKTRYRIFISGTAKERALLDPLFEKLGDRVVDLTGKLNLAELITFIAHADGLVANSTGPLHIAAALGKDALGIYPPIRPMHPGRWAPLGPNAQVFVMDRSCQQCRSAANACTCMLDLSPSLIKAALDQLSAQKLPH